MTNYLKCGVILAFLFTLYGCDSGSENSTKIEQQVDSSRTVETESSETSADVTDLVNEAVVDAEEKAAEEKAAIVMADFEDKFNASTQDMSEEDRTAAKQLLEDFQQKLQAQQGAPQEP